MSAIVGIGLRFPGGACSPSDFWSLLSKARDGIIKVPENRWKAGQLLGGGEEPGKMIVEAGGFLQHLELFDPQCFGISPREGVCIDPQQRLLLECAWECFEDASTPLNLLSGSQTGVFVGLMNHDDFIRQHIDRKGISQFTNVGTAMSIAANRLSFVFNLCGPSLAIDTACSSGLVAGHYAHRSLQLGECTAALVGAVNVCLLPDIFVALSKMQMLAPDARCRAFDASGTGYVRGEGCGVVLLKSEADAVCNGDRIYAVIRGSAINSDGRREVPITAPSGVAQMDVLRKAYADADISPHAVQFVEAHGTGTRRGDPVEAGALGAILGSGRGEEDGCVRIGSVKTNIGHLESASGLAGLIKTALCLSHMAIPPNLHFTTPNPAIDFAGLNLRVMTKFEEWPARDPRSEFARLPAVAGVNSFGFGGTNVHMVLTPARPVAAVPSCQEVKEEWVVLPVSARTRAGLLGASARWAEFLETGQTEPHSVLFTAALHRTHHTERLCVIGSEVAALPESLQLFADGLSVTSAFSGRVSGEPRVILALSGQGCQWRGMGEALLRSGHYGGLARAKLEEIDGHLGLLSGVSVMEELFRDPHLLDETQVTQPCIFALQIVLWEILRFWGVVPVAVVGHSVGEVAAAVIAGVLSLEDACKVVHHRSQLQGRCQVGAMMAVKLSSAAVSEFLNDRLVLAGDNSSDSVTVSGESEEIQSLANTLKSRKIPCKILPIHAAFHSSAMDPIREELLAALAGLGPTTPPKNSPVWFSSVSGDAISSADAEYWWRNVRQPVLFVQALRRAIGTLKADTVVEVGPHGVLLRYCQKTALEFQLESSRCIATGTRNVGEPRALAAAFARLHCSGVPVDWTRAFPSLQCRRESGCAMHKKVALPLYPFQRQRLWVDTPISNFDREGQDWEVLPVVPHQQRSLDHFLLAPLSETRSPVSLSSLQSPTKCSVCWPAPIPAVKWVTDHVLQGHAIVPGACWVDIGLQSILRFHVVVQRALGKAKGFPRGTRITLSNFMFLRPRWVRPEETSVEMAVWVLPVASSPGEATVCITEGPTTAEAVQAALAHPRTVPGSALFARGTGKLMEEKYIPDSVAALPSDALDIPDAAVLPAEWSAVNADSYFDRLSERGLEYREEFRAVRRMWLCPARKTGVMELIPHPNVASTAEMDWSIHPVLFDAGFQGFCTLLPEDKRLVIAVGFNKLHLLHPVPTATLWAVYQLLNVNEHEARGSVWWIDPESRRVLAVVEEARVQILSANVPLLHTHSCRLMYSHDWVPRSLPAFPAETVGGGVRFLVLAKGCLLDAPVMRMLQEMVDWSKERWALFSLEPVGKKEFSFFDATVLPHEPQEWRESFLAAIRMFGEPSATVIAFPTAGERSEEQNHRHLAHVETLLNAFKALDGLVSCPCFTVLPFLQASNMLNGPVEGFIRTAAMEVQALRPHLVYVELEEGKHPGQGLWAEISQPSPDQEVVLAEERRVARLSQLKIDALPPQTALFNPDGVYIVVGGTGGFGTLLVRWLAGRGVRRAAILCRSGPSKEVCEAFSDLADQMRFTVHRCDVSVEQEVEAVLSALREEGPPISGVFLSAMIIEDNRLQHLSRENFVRVWGCKVFAGWTLHRLTLEDPLTHFIAFSSVASLLGNPGQTNYASANSYLDALMVFRRSSGAPGVSLSVQWGTLGSVGIVSREAKVARHVMGYGFRLIHPDIALSALERLLVPSRSTPAVVGVVDVVWRDWTRFFDGQWNLSSRFDLMVPDVPSSDSAVEDVWWLENFNKTGPVLAAGPGEENPFSVSALLQKFVHHRQTDASAQIVRPFARQIVALETASVLGLTVSPSSVEKTVLPPNEPLLSFGIDSLLASELKVRLENNFNAHVPVALLLQGGTVATVAESVMKGVRHDPDGSSPPAVEVEPRTLHHRLIQPSKQLPRVVHRETEITEPFSLNDLQLGYWVGRSGSLESSAPCHFYFEFDSLSLDVAALTKAFQHLIARHDSLRSVVSFDGRMTVLQTCPPYVIEVLELPENGTAVEEELQRLREVYSHEQLPATEWPMFSVRCTKTGHSRQRLHINLDHIMVDIKSALLLLAEWKVLYHDGPSSLPDIPITYKDYAEVAASLQDDAERMQISRGYWMARLDSLPMAPELPKIHQENAGSQHFRRLHTLVSSENWSSFKLLCRQHGVTPASTLVTAFAYAIGRWSCSNHFLINFPVFSRLPVHTHVEWLAGDFTSSVLLEVLLDKSSGFADNVKRVQLQLAQDSEHSMFSGVKVIRERMKRRSASEVAAPIVFTSIVDSDAADAYGWLGEDVFGLSETPQVHVDCHVYILRGQLAVNLDFVAALFPEGMMEDLFGSFTAALGELCTDRSTWERPGSIIQIPDRQLSIRHEVNTTTSDFPLVSVVKAILDRFQGFSDDATAIVSFSNGARTRLGFATLLECAATLANKMQLKFQSCVIVALPKGWQQIVAMLAIWLAGGICVPVDSESPAGRLRNICGQVRAELILTTGAVAVSDDCRPLLVPSTPEEIKGGCSELLLAEVLEKIAHGGFRGVNCRADNLAYVLFTSGSTGEPKGVKVTHKSLLNTVLHALKEWEITQADVIMGVSSLHFDLAMFDVVGGLLSGATLVLPNPATAMMPSHWMELCLLEKISVWNSVPALLRLLIEHAKSVDGAPLLPLRLVVLSGDVIPVALPSTAASCCGSGLRVVAAGGPTEDTIWCISHEPPAPLPPPAATPRIPYGRPFPNMSVHILSSDLEENPDWVPGTMYFGGMGVSPGYWEAPSLDDMQFIVHPTEGFRLHNTGDVGAWLPGGVVDILGRRDNQVKVNGNRIELDEIANVALKDPRVSQAVAVIKGARQQLVLYILPATKAKPSGPKLLTGLEAVEFKMKQHGVRSDLGGVCSSILPLERSLDRTEEWWMRRRTVRRFDWRVPVETRIMDALLGPILPLAASCAVFALVLPERVTKSAEGCFPTQAGLYRCIEGEWRGIRDGAVLSGSVFGSNPQAGNRSVYEGCAVAVVVASTAPAPPDLVQSAGAASQTVMELAGVFGVVGVCPIGGFNFDPLWEMISESAPREEYHHIHTLLIGSLPDKTGSVPDPTPTSPLPKFDLVESVVKRLQASLPAYMQPQHVVMLLAFPLTQNNKVDLKALPDVDASISSSSATSGAVLETSDAVKAVIDMVLPLCQKILQLETLEPNSDLFLQGADSVSCIQIVSAASRIGLSFTIRDVFSTRTVAALSCLLIKQGQTVASPIEDRQIEAFPMATANPTAQFAPFPLSVQQEAYFVGRSDAFELGNISTHGYIEFAIANPSIKRLTRALQRMIDRHDMLRAVFQESGTQTILPVTDIPPYSIRVVQIETPSAVRRVRDKMSHFIFEPSRWPLFEILLSAPASSAANDETVAGNCTIHFGYDMLIFDVRSLFLFLDEWMRLYDGITPLPRLSLSYRDYLLHVMELRHGGAFEASKRYWWSRLDKLPPAPALPVRNTAVKEAPVFSRMRSEFKPQEWQQLQSIAASRKLTLSGVLLTVFAEVIRCWSTSAEFTLNLPVFNRLPVHKDVSMVIGDFTSTVLLAVTSDPSRTFEERCTALHALLLEHLEHRYVSGIEVLRERNRRLRTRNPNSPISLMPVVFTSALHVSAPALEQEGRGQYLSGISQTSQVWLDCQVYFERGNLAVNWDAVEGVFLPNVLTDMFNAFIGFLRRLCVLEDLWTATSFDLVPRMPAANSVGGRARAVSASSLKIPADLETSKSFSELIGLPPPLLSSSVRSVCLHEPFLRHAKRHPNAVAIIQSDGQRWSYRTLLRRVRAVRNCLLQENVTPGARVAVVMDHGIEQVVAVIGTLWAGAVYVPMSPEWPAMRIGGVMKRVDAKMVLSQSWLRSRATDVKAIEGLGSVPWFAVDLAPASTAVQPGEDAQLQSPDKAAYIIFTSGSTGEPKGVVISHSSAWNTITTINQMFNISRRDRVLSLSALSFDLSVFDIFGPLSVGGACVYPAAEKLKDPSSWLPLMLDQRVTVWNSVPQVMELLVEYCVLSGQRIASSLRIVLLSGDWINVTLPRRLRAMAPPLTLVSLGGATEGSIWSIFHVIETVDPGWTSIPYGKALPGQSMHVLDPSSLDAGLPVPRPTFVTGEIVIGGRGVAMEYWGDAQETQRRFFEHPVTGERLYRTGDLGRLLPSGDIEFLGRMDNQVKVNGYRVELGEVESALLRCNSVHQAVALLHIVNDAPVLAAFVTLASSFPAKVDPMLGLEQRRDQFKKRSLLPKELKEQLSGFLPGYMVPQKIVVLEQLPLNENRKVDRGSLPLEELFGDETGMFFPSHRTSVARSIASTLSANALLRRAVEELASTILDCFCTILPPNSLSADTNILEVGARSLHVVRIVNSLQKRLTDSVSVVDLFQHPSAEALAISLIEKREVAKEQSSRRQSIRRGSTTSKHLGMATTDLLLEEAEDLERLDAAVEKCSDIAIIGIGCRVAGASTKELFWKTLVEARSTVKVFTDDQLRAAGYTEERIADPARLSACGVLSEFDSIDVNLFELNKDDLPTVDPQHRALLETSYAALEDAAYVTEEGDDEPGRRCGVFVSISFASYMLNNLSYRREAMQSFPGMLQLMVGNDKDYAPTRISYLLNLKGPSVAIQSACSSSFSSLILATRALQHGDCSMAVVGAATVACPQVLCLTGNTGILARDGKVRTFDAEAHGTVRSSGAVSIVVKPLDAASADGDHVYAIIKGAAVNNDGSHNHRFRKGRSLAKPVNNESSAAKGPLKTPNADMQGGVVSQALADANIDASTIGYVECHGTGTLLGDPVEVFALSTAFGKHTKQVQYCGLGSVKTSIGHLECAAGLASLVKTVLGLHHRQIPATLNFSTPNPSIDFESSPFYVNDALREWTVPAHCPPGTPRRAGVNSFGFGGTNAHVVLEEAPALPMPPALVGPQLVIVSAKTSRALRNLLVSLALHLRSHTELRLADVSYTLMVGRRPLDFRVAVVSSTVEEAAASLLTASRRDDLPPEVHSDCPAVIFCFPGEFGLTGGGDLVWPDHRLSALASALSAGLCRGVPSIRRAVLECTEIVTEILHIDLGHLVTMEDGLENATDDGYFYSPTAPVSPRPIRQKHASSDVVMKHIVLFITEYAVACMWKDLGVRPAAVFGVGVGEYVSAVFASLLSLTSALKAVTLRAKLLGSGKQKAIEVQQAITSLQGNRRPRLPMLSSVTGQWLRTPDSSAKMAPWTAPLAGQDLNVPLMLETLSRADPVCKGQVVTMGPPVKAGVPCISLEAPIESLLQVAGFLWTNGVCPSLQWRTLHGVLPPSDPNRPPPGTAALRRRVPLVPYPFERERFFVDAPRQDGKSGPGGLLNPPMVAVEEEEPSLEEMRQRISALTADVERLTEENCRLRGSHA